MTLRERGWRGQVLSVVSGFRRVQRFKRGTLMTEQYVREEYPLSRTTGKIIAAAQVVHRELGPGFEEVIQRDQPLSACQRFCGESENGRRGPRQRHT